MAIPPALTYQGANKEFQFRDQFVMPLLVRLGFGIVVNYHGQREYGRDIVFGDLDRFGHVVYYGMQLKYEPSISLAGSRSLIDDALQATRNPFRHPQTGRSEYISSFYVANAGDFSDQARENFFNNVESQGVRNAKLLAGNALMLLEKAGALNRASAIRERLTGLLQEMRRNRNMAKELAADLQAYAADTEQKPYPMLRCRNTAASTYLSAPFPVPNLPIDVVDRYFEIIRLFNQVADSIDGPISAGEFRKNRTSALPGLANDMNDQGGVIERAVLELLTRLGVDGPL